MASSDEAKELAKRIRQSKAKDMRADGLSGSSAALLLAAVASGRGACPNMLVVMNDVDDAEIRGLDYRIESMVEKIIAQIGKKVVSLQFEKMCKSQITI